MDCEVCSDLPKPVRDMRSLLISEAVEQGSWPSNWLERLSNIQDMVFQTPLDATSPKSNESAKKSKSNETTKKSNTKTKKKVCSKELITSSSSSSSETDEDQYENQTEDKNGDIQTKPKQVDSSQGQSVGSEDWQTSITSTVSTLAANMQAMMEQMKKMTESKTKGKKPKSKKPKMTKSKQDSDVEPAKKRRKTNSNSTPPSTSTSTNYQTPPEQPLYSYSLPEELMQPPLPSNLNIPRFSNQETFHEASDLVYNSSEESDTELEVDINRTDKRKLYLQGLKSLVPSLKHSQQTEQLESGHFSLITRAPNTNIMPMLDEVYTQVSNTASKDCIINKQRKKILTNTSKFYMTTEPAESGFLQPRTIPRELLHHVNPNKLNKKGASGKSATLTTNIKQGVKESQALASFKHAANSIRIANNMEIGIEAQGSLIKRCQRNIAKIKEFDVPEEVQGYLGSLNTSLQLMNQTLFDIKSSNNDLMKMSLGQYNQSLTDRREAWLTATDLPIGLVQELKDSDQTFNLSSDQKGPLQMFNQQDINMLKDYNAAEKDLAIVRACNVRANANRGRGRGQQSRFRPFGRGASSSIGRGYEHQQPSFQSNRARGRGRSSRPRGQRQSQSFRGQAGQKYS